MPARKLLPALVGVGRLPVTWMKSAAQQPINVGDGQTPLFPFGYGLRYRPLK